VIMGKARRINWLGHSLATPSSIVITSSLKWQVSRLVGCLESVNSASRKRYIVNVSSVLHVGRKTALATKSNG
jgi:hypothetical protein